MRNTSKTEEGLVAALYWYIIDDGLPPMYAWWIAPTYRQAALDFTQWRLSHRCTDWAGLPVDRRAAEKGERDGEIVPSVL